MTTDRIAFPITIVSTDRALLRETSWMLGSCGMQASSSTDWSNTAIWRLSDRPSLLLLDARDQEQIEAFLERPRNQPYHYVIAFCDSDAETYIAKLLDSGVEDILSLPTNSNELRTRVQAGLRRVEFECRLAKTISKDPKSGYDTCNGFAKKLQQKIRDQSGADESVVVAVGIDSQDILCGQFGALVYEMANQTLAKCITEQTTDEDFCAALDDGVFLVYLENSAVREGVQCAELIVKEFKAQNVLAPEFGVRITVSGTVFGVPKDTEANEVVSRTLQAFQQVKNSGGNAILDAFAMEQAFATWMRQATSADANRAALARHIMLPLPCVLPADTANKHHSEQLGILVLDSEAPHPPCASVLDRQGRFLGVVDPSRIDWSNGHFASSVSEHLEPTSATASCSQPTNELAETMDEAGSDYLVILDGERPVGFVTRSMLPTTDSFSVNDSLWENEVLDGYELERLVVPA